MTESFLTTLLFLLYNLNSVSDITCRAEVRAILAKLIDANNVISIKKSVTY